MAGFYQSNYVDTLGTKRRLAVTQFEAIDARRCFPCVDEPARKAKFKVTITCDKKYQAFSNMPEVSRTSNEAEGTVSFDFRESPKMSTYLLAFLVGELDYITKETTGEHGPVTMVRCMSVQLLVLLHSYLSTCGAEYLISNVEKKEQDALLDEHKFNV